MMEETDRQQHGSLKGTKRQIIDVARRLFSDRSYLGVSMSDIAKRLGVTKAALYHHFAGKSDIYHSVLDDVLADLRARLCEERYGETLDEQLHRMVKDYMGFGMREKNLVNALVVKLPPAETELNQQVAPLKEELDGYFLPVIERAIEQGRLPDGVDGHLATTMLTALMDGLILGRSFLGKPLDPDTVSNQILVFLGLSGWPEQCF
ncbi:MAG: TetR/AcrR family transcriptional regulator [Coriobacteriia bacterium]